MVWIVILFSLCSSALAGNSLYKEIYRPQIHGTPPKGWAGYPTGLWFYDGLFYYSHEVYSNASYPPEIYWVINKSKDLLHHETIGIPIYPTENGDPYPGQIVVDKKNKAGFKKKKDGPDPFVAFFTRHNDDNDTQEVWYSLDKGASFQPFKGNPVLKDPASPEYETFRNPKARKYGDKWIAPIAVDSSVEFYESYDLKKWKYLSTFGPGEGAQYQYWECPDLVPFEIGDQVVYILIVSVYDGGPNVGDGVQYFVGTFDGKRFMNKNSPDTILWFDYGNDFYCFKTWESTPLPYWVGIGWVNIKFYKN